MSFPLTGRTAHGSLNFALPELDWTCWTLLHLAVVLSKFASRTLDNSLDSIKTHLQRIHLRTVADTHEMMAWTVEEIATLSWIEVEEDAWDDNGLLLEQSVEEGEPVADVDWRVLWQWRFECG